MCRPALGRIEARKPALPVRLGCGTTTATGSSWLESEFWVSAFGLCFCGSRTPRTENGVGALGNIFLPDKQFVGERRDFRFETNQLISLTILGRYSRDADAHLSASMVNVSGRGISLTTEFSVPVSSAVRLDVNDNILLGEVCHSRQTGPSEFICGVRLEQALTAVGDLSKLVSGIMDETPRLPSTPVEAEAPYEAQTAPKERRRLTAILSRF